ncbi:MAG: hypothetical protein WBB28_00050 [Crinalium sp.]
MKTKQHNTGQVVKAKYPNTVGHTGFQACGEEVGLQECLHQKHFSGKQESPVTTQA